MRLFSREQDVALPRWVDDGELRWSPKEPLALEKRLKPRHDGSRGVSSRLKRGMVRMFGRTRSGSARLEPAPLSPRFGNVDRDGKPELRSAPAGRSAPASEAAPKGTLPASTPDWLLRLGIGLAQGVALALLFLAHDQNIWPGSEPAFSTALLLAGIMAPLALLEGFDQVEPKLLLLWSGTLGFLIATLGLWQQWRGGLEVMPVVTIALLVLLAHITLRAALREMRLWPGYEIWTETAWTIGARLLVWGTIAILAFVVIAAFNGILGWALALFGVSFRNAATLISMPLLGMASAAGFAVAADGWVQKRTRSTLLASCAAALPILSTAALALLGLYLAQAKIPHGILLGLAAALVIAVHAFDWKLVPRRWRRIAQGLFGFVILESTLIAGLDIHARVAAHGWTDMRIYAAVAAFVLALYGLVYLAESFAAMRGARTLKVLDRAIPLLALLVALTCLMLSTPLGDPLALAVKSQVGRFERDPAQFDFSWLKNQGGRFGQEALARLDSRPAPAPAIPASSVSLALAPAPAVQPLSEALPRPIDASHAPASKPQTVPAVLHGLPPAAMPGPALKPVAPPQAEPEPAGDIVQHTAGEFPAELLAENWSRTDAAPCLTKASVTCDIWFLDLDGDGRKEILFAYGDGTRVKANVMRQTRGRWIEAAAVASPPCQGLLARVRNQTGGLLPGWRGALRTGLRQRPGAPPAELPCPRD